MTHHPQEDTDRNVGGVLRELGDDQGRPLPATPEEMLARGRQRRRNRQIALAASGLTAAFALLLGGVAVTALNNRAVTLQPAGNGPSMPARLTPAPSGAPTPATVDGEEVITLNDSARLLHSVLMLPDESGRITTVAQHSEKAEVAVARVAGSPELDAQIRERFNDIAFPEGVQLRLVDTKYSANQLQKLHGDVLAEARRIVPKSDYAKVMPLIGLDPVVAYADEEALKYHLSYVEVATTGDVAALQARFSAKFGDAVLVRDASAVLPPAKFSREELQKVYDEIERDLPNLRRQGFQVSLTGSPDWESVRVMLANEAKAEALQKLLDKKYPEQTFVDTTK